MARRGLIERRQDAQAARVQVALHAAAARRALARVGLRAVLAGKEAGGERIVGDDTEPFALADRRIVALEFGAVVEIVKGL
jgi:hypothetical protein